jgi:hypothetical protein
MSMAWVEHPVLSGFLYSHVEKTLGEYFGQVISPKITQRKMWEKLANCQ